MHPLATLSVATGIALVASGCIYSDVRMPRAYRSATPSDVKAAPADPTVSGEACYQTLFERLCTEITALGFR